MSVTVGRLWARCGHGTSATIIGVLASDCHEIIALNVLHRADGAPVTLDMVTGRLDQLLTHRRSCDCGLCEAAARVIPERILRTVATWQREAGVTGTPPTGGHVDGEQARMLYRSGLTVAEVAAELGCSVKTATRHRRTPETPPPVQVSG